MHIIQEVSNKPLMFASTITPKSKSNRPEANTLQTISPYYGGVHIKIVDNIEEQPMNKAIIQESSSTVEKAMKPIFFMMTAPYQKFSENPPNLV